jgi:hypothetical protein
MLKWQVLVLLPLALTSVAAARHVTLKVQYASRTAFLRAGASAPGAALVLWCGATRALSIL